MILRLKFLIDSLSLILEFKADAKVTKLNHREYGSFIDSTKCRLEQFSSTVVNLSIM